MASSQYRDTSDSDSRGLSDPQVFLELRARMILKEQRTESYPQPFLTLLREGKRENSIMSLSESGDENKPEFRHVGKMPNIRTNAPI